MVYLEIRKKEYIMPKKKSISSKRKTTTSKAKATKVENMSQTHGKEEFAPSTLDQVWGDTGLSKYGTMDEDEYATQVRDMTKSELFAHASRHGIIPIENRDQLEKRCIREFVKHTSSYTKPKAQQSNHLAKNELPLEIRKILDEGK